MYEEPKKMSKSKKIEITILIILLLYGALFLLNYLRYTKSKPPLIAIKVTHNYEDGHTYEYYSLGYVYRKYNRNSIQDEELVPFWHLIKNPAPESDLPKTYKDYNVPTNQYRDDKYKGLLYFYTQSTLIGTYKCLNSENNCNKAISGYDEYNLINTDYITKREYGKLDMLDKKYAFIDDSIEQEKKYGEPNYVRTIYLFDIKNNKILAQYSDIKESIYNSKEKISTGDNNRYIVKHHESKKWGVISIDEKGNVSESIPFNYESINFDEDTGYYILCEEGKWSIYDINKEEIILSPIDNIIYDVWINYNKTTYYKISTNKTSEYPEFKVYRLDGTPFIDASSINVIYPKDTFIMYFSPNEKVIRFIDYGKEIKKEVPVNFTSLTEDELTLPSFTVRYESDRYLSLRVYETSNLAAKYKDYHIDTKVWK